MMNIVKEWKNIKGYEKLYKVSNYGEVKSKRRVIYAFIDGELQPSYVMPERVLSPTDNGNGYLIIGLIDEKGVRQNKYVHRLVADAFIPNPNNYPQVNHLDYDRKNNRVTNLEWCTAEQNVNHSKCNQPKSRRCFSKTGYKHIYLRNNKYRLCTYIKGKRTDKTFATLEEALAMRKVIAEKEGVEIED